MIAIISHVVDSCKLHAAYEVKAKALAAVATSKHSFSHMGILLAFGYVANSLDNSNTYN